MGEFKEVARWHVKVLNESVASLNTSRIRMHMCWGNYPGPHDKDIPLKEIANIVLEAKPELLSVEACNPGHAHEHEVWGKDFVNVPANKTFLPGVIDTTSSHVEHPELVKQRLRQYVVALRQANSKRERENGTAAGANNLSRDLVFKKIA